jgi:hypothetical protein
MTIRSLLHKTIDKSFNAVDRTRKIARETTQKAAAAAASRLSKDPVDIELAKLEKQKQELIARKHVTNKVEVSK